MSPEVEFAAFVESSVAQLTPLTAEGFAAQRSRGRNVDVSSWNGAVQYEQLIWVQQTSHSCNQILVT